MLKSVCVGEEIRLGSAIAWLEAGFTGVLEVDGEDDNQCESEGNGQEFDREAEESEELSNISEEWILEA
jgi:hypothetical protein